MIRQTEVDGVPALVAPTGGPSRAGLVFRVGQADETLARRGITHLLEHLVLHPLGDADYHYNGVTGTTATHFHLQGPVDAVGSFLTGVCRSLRDLDTGRIDVERSIVLTEEGGRATGPLDSLPLWRHGARDHGLVSFPQWGLHGVLADDLRDWAARYFTRENAVLWFAGETLPDGLTLDLPAGERHPVPAASSALPTTPACYTGDSYTTALDAVVRHRPAAQVLAGVLERQLFRALRQEAGLSYTAATTYDVRGDGFAVLTAFADALPGNQDAALGGFLDVLAALRVGRVDEADVTAVVTRAIDSLTADDADAVRLPGAAFHLLTGQPVLQCGELVSALKAVDVDAVREAAAEALGTALLMTPRGTSAGWAGYAQAPTGTTEEAGPTQGVTYPYIGDPSRRLVVGAEKAVAAGPGALATTVRFDDCAVLLSYPDGGRLLVGADAASVRIEPTLHRGVDVAAIDARVPIERQVRMPARDPDQVPVPRPAQDAPAVPVARHTATEKLTLGVLALVTLVSGGLALGLTVGMALGVTSLRVLPVVGCWITAGYFGRKLREQWRER
ncbi:insulinase family protein [Micromonospora humidisoli]|uniref:Insulinase family protein n=1 Tax=Micromonospora humidisoli TaxID=2807622 RepID=A0ABS2JEA5_9ACTN|nr:insulinase family protein [Micromonospora humidisoli]MBM7084877.1 insulinase family protein [Micromonospora humidisoli]